jgi:hypothetical protein
VGADGAVGVATGVCVVVCEVVVVLGAVATEGVPPPELPHAANKQTATTENLCAILYFLNLQDMHI